MERYPEYVYKVSVFDFIMETLFSLAFKLFWLFLISGQMWSIVEIYKRGDTKGVLLYTTLFFFNIFVFWYVNKDKFITPWEEHKKKTIERQKKDYDKILESNRDELHIRMWGNIEKLEENKQEKNSILKDEEKK